MTLNRILYIARGGLISGSQRQLLNLLARLDRKQYEPLVICSEGGDFSERLNDMGIETQIYPSFYGWRKPRFLLHRYFLRAALLRPLTERQIHLIHCSYQWYAPYCRYLARRLKCPYLIHIRGPINRSAMWKYRFDSADHVISISPRSQKDLIGAGICPTKVSVVYDSIDTELFRPQSPASQRFGKNGDFVFGMVGRVEPAKCQLEFVKAARIIASRHTNVRFVVVGQPRNNDYAQQVKQLIKDSDLSDCVVLYGYCDQMSNTLSGFDVLVSLSGGSVMYEAMACGVPILSAGFTRKEDAVHVIHGHNAFLVESRDPDHIAQAMEKMLLDSRYTHALAANTRSHVLSHLTDKRMATQIQSVYAQLIGRR